MPTYRIPASLYIEAEDMHAALQTATLYLDDAAHVLRDLASEAYPGLVAVDVDTHLAEECPLNPAENDSASHWEDRPHHPASEWQREVAEEETRLGYADWCRSREESANA